MLIAFLGKKGSGKDTAADFMIKNHGFIKYVFADPLKKGLKCFFNLTDQQLYDEKLKEEIDPRWGVSPRKLMQTIGTDIFQYLIHEILPELKGEHRNHWVTLFKEWYLDLKKKDPNLKIVIADARFLNEVKTINELGGIVCKIIRPSRGNNDQHLSENEINQIPDQLIDNVIINDGSLDDIYLKVSNLILADN
jgi:hypothetical protein